MCLAFTRKARVKKLSSGKHRGQWREERAGKEGEDERRAKEEATMVSLGGEVK